MIDLEAIRKRNEARKIPIARAIANSKPEDIRWVNVEPSIADIDDLLAEVQRLRDESRFKGLRLEVTHEKLLRLGHPCGMECVTKALGRDAQNYPEEAGP